MSAYSSIRSDERNKEEPTTAAAAGGGGGATMSLSELLELTMPPSHRPEQQIPMDRHSMENGAAGGMGNFLDELIMDNWDDNDSNDDDNELVFHHGNTDVHELLEMEEFSGSVFKASTASSAALLSAATPDHQEDAAATPALMVPAALGNNCYAVAASISPPQGKKPRQSWSGRKPIAIAAPTHATGTHAAGFVPGKTRMRRKLEIQLLREESERLQQKLQDLREYWKLMSTAAEQDSRTKNTDTKNRSMRAALVRAESMWKPIAVRQQEVLTQSECENQNLKTQFLLQRKMLQRIRKLIMKRANTAKKMQSEIKFKPTPNPDFVVAACMSTFYKLLADSVSMYMDLSKVQGLFQMRDAEKQIFREWTVKDDTAGSTVRLEMVDSNVTPFSWTQVGEALLRSFGVESLQKKKAISEYFQSSDDTIVRQFISSFSTLTQGNGVVRVKQVVRTFSDENQSIFVINALLERLTESGTPRHQIRSKKWVVVRSCSNGRSTGGGSSASSIQSFYTLKPEVADEEYGASWCKPMIEEVLVPILDLGTTKCHQELENALIEQDRNMSKRIGISAH